MNSLNILHLNLMPTTGLKSSKCERGGIKDLTAAPKSSYGAIYLMHFPSIRLAGFESQRFVLWIILGIGDDGLMHFVGASIFPESTDNQILRLLISLKLEGVRNITHLCTDFPGVIDEKPVTVFGGISVHLMKSTLLRKTLHKISWKECPLVTRQVNHVLSALSEEQGQMRRTFMMSQAKGKNISAVETLQRYWPVIRSQLSLPNAFRMKVVDNKLVNIICDKIKKKIRQEQTAVKYAVLLNALKDMIDPELMKQHDVECLSNDIGVSLLKAILMNN